MTKLEQAARQALGALEVATTPLAKDRQEVLRAITTLREALSGVQALSAAPAVDITTAGEMQAFEAWYKQDCVIEGAAAKMAAKAAWKARAMLAASPTPPAEQQAAATEGYVQPVPDKCDRITWRGRYYYLPLTEQDAPKAAPKQESTASNESAYQRGYMDGMAKGRRDAETAPQPAPHLPERDASLPAERQGLFRKFVVGRVDGSDKPGDKHHGCTYFVLDVDHDPCARPALAAYAAARESTHPTLAADLRTKWGVVPAPQPAPAPLSEPIDQLERALAIIGVVGAIGGHDVVRRESLLEIARRAAIAAQGGK